MDAAAAHYYPPHPPPHTQPSGTCGACSSWRGSWGRRAGASTTRAVTGGGCTTSRTATALQSASATRGASDSSSSPASSTTASRWPSCASSAWRSPWPPARYVFRRRRCCAFRSPAPPPGRGVVLRGHLQAPGRGRRAAAQLRLQQGDYARPSRPGPRRAPGAGVVHGTPAAPPDQARAPNHPRRTGGGDRSARYGHSSGLDDS